MAHILVVDDSTTMRQMVCFTLTSVKHTVVEAENGVEALKQAQNHKFDLVIADVNMPEMNGIDLIRALRGILSYKFIPILMLTTESSDEMKAKGKAAGANGWLVKPFDPQRLIDVVKKVIG